MKNSLKGNENFLKGNEKSKDSSNFHNFLSPVWTLRCAIKLLLFEKDFSQLSHWYFFTRNEYFWCARSSRKFYKKIFRKICKFYSSHASACLRATSTRWTIWKFDCKSCKRKVEGLCEFANALWGWKKLKTFSDIFRSRKASPCCAFEGEGSGWRLEWIFCCKCCTKLVCSSSACEGEAPCSLCSGKPEKKENFVRKN